jgi:hypothetical protein
MIQLAKWGIRADPQDIVHYRAEFGTHHFIKLKDFLEPELLSLAVEYVERDRWKTIAEKDFYREDIQGGPAYELLHFLSNSPNVLRVAGELTGCGPFTRFWGRIYRAVPGADHMDNWHDDFSPGRRVAISVNLSPGCYSGGILQMRERCSGRIFAEVENHGLGDAVLFRVCPDFTHRVTTVVGQIPRVAFVGWFYVGEESFWAWHHSARADCDRMTRR